MCKMDRGGGLLSKSEEQKPLQVADSHSIGQEFLQLL
jgi:hypothetical protein